MSRGFSFCRNRNRYIRESFSEERVKISRQHLLEFLGLAGLEGRSFLGIVCGSGLHSLAAFRAGASRVVSIDIDRLSVQAPLTIREKAGSPPGWEVLEGSVLDPEYVSRLEPADIVYSWDVLYHTGNLWNAMGNAAGRVLPCGLFYIALSEKTSESAYWTDVKRRYNAASLLRRRPMGLGYVYRVFLRTKSPTNLLHNFRYIRDHSALRGMTFWTNVRDWLGGWPYEPATPAKVTDFCERTLGLRTEKVKGGEANVEYLFARA